MKQVGKLLITSDTSGSSSRVIYHDPLAHRIDWLIHNTYATPAPDLWNKLLTSPPPLTPLYEMALWKKTPFSLTTKVYM